MILVLVDATLEGEKIKTATVESEINKKKNPFWMQS